VPTYLFIPGSFLVVIVVAFNLLGDSLRDALDPRATR
jgi:peptide/nickel transport system permease protein